MGQAKKAGTLPPIRGWFSSGSIELEAEMGL